MTNRVSYLQVLGTKNPAEVLTKHVPADLFQQQSEATSIMATDGQASVATALNTLEAVLFLPEVSLGPNKVRFAATVSCNAVLALGKSREVGRRDG